jgi:16S rRNA (guanine966-N2)-methyltransferase
VVRIIGGRWRGRRLPVADVATLRPTPDRVRETVFNWLMPVIEGAICLDLFAGTGALGFEAASRGAARVVMVEQHPLLVAMLRKQAAVLQAGQVSIVAGEAVSWLAGTADSFDAVFLDPPYASDLLPRCLALLLSRAILRPGALVYVEHSIAREAPAGWRMVKRSRAGRVIYGLLTADTSK